jgi:uncharacterized protein DUF6058
VTRATFTDGDVVYINANYRTLDELCTDRTESAAEVQALIDQGRLPQPSYVLDDGTAMFPTDYFRLVEEACGVDALCSHFTARYRAASRREPAHVEELDRDWHAFMNGVYGVCLRQVTPETIVRKTVLVSSLCELLMLPRPRSRAWRRVLREQVDELDTLEREFSPHYDRSDEQDRPPTRDLLVNAARARFPDVFAA